MSKEPEFLATLSDIDLNYIDACLASEIRKYEAEIADWGNGHGNCARLLRQCKRTRNKLRRVHYPPNGKPKIPKEILAIIKRGGSNES